MSVLAELARIGTACSVFALRIPRVSFVAKYSYRYDCESEKSTIFSNERFSLKLRCIAHAFAQTTTQHNDNQLLAINRRHELRTRERYTH